MAGIVAEQMAAPQGQPNPAPGGGMAVAIEQKIDQFPEMVIQKLTDGAGDLELELAETAGNLVRAELGDNKVDDIELLKLCGMVVASLMRYVVKADLVEPNAAGQLMQKATVMARQIAKTGPGSVE